MDDHQTSPINRRSSEIFMASTAIVTFATGYITTTLGQKALDAAKARVVAPVDVIAFSMLATVMLAVAARRYPCLNLEECSSMFIMLASSSICDILLQQRKFVWIMYVPCLLPMSFLLYRVSRLMLAWIRTRVYPCIVRLFVGATNVLRRFAARSSGIESEGIELVV